MGLPTAQGLYPYNPSGPASILFNVLYNVLIWPHLSLSIWWCRDKRMKHRYTIALLIAAIIAAIGYSVRTASINNSGAVGLYAASFTLIVISATFVCATLYLLLVRLIQMYLPPTHQRFFNASPGLLGKLLIFSDVISFITQVCGSAVAASGSWQGNSKTVGTNLLLGGLALQLGTFSFFLIVAWQFVCQANLRGQINFDPNLKKMMMGVWIAGFFVEIRSVYRVIEFVLVVEGQPFQYEWPFYVFEAVPILLAIGTLACFHPVRLLQKDSLAITSARSEDE